MNGFVEREGQSSNIQWGRMAAGAAVVGGIVLAGVAIASGDVPILSQIAEGVQLMATSAFNSIGTAISSTGTASALPAPELADKESSVFSALGSYLNNAGTFLQDNAKSLGGAALLATGLGYFTIHPASGVQQGVPALAPAISNDRLQTAQMGFAAREQMRAVNALMQSRMQAFGSNDRQV